MHKASKIFRGRLQSTLQCIQRTRHKLIHRVSARFFPLHNGGEKLLSFSLSPLQDKVDSFTGHILSWCDINALLENFIKGYKALKTGNKMWRSRDVTLVFQLCGWYFKFCPKTLVKMHFSSFFQINKTTVQLSTIDTSHLREMLHWDTTVTTVTTTLQR